ncbi:MAG: hypothetical protein ACP5GU_03495 [Thermoprotei archaeon]
MSESLRRDEELLKRLMATQSLHLGATGYDLEIIQLLIKIDKKLDELMKRVEAIEKKLEVK